MIRIVVQISLLMLINAFAVRGYSQGDPSDATKSTDDSVLDEAAGQGYGQDPKMEGDLLRDFRFIAKDLRCPTCQGMSVLESDAKFSRQIKDMVKTKMDEGWDKQKILSFFTERYGPWILREPPKEGFSLVAWILPIALLLLGPILLWLGTFRKRKEVPTEGVRNRGEILDEMINRLESLRHETGGGSNS